MDDAAQIAAGSIVILKSGGPKMTVLHKSKTFGGWWRCAWIDQRGLFQSQELPEHSLVSVRDFEQTEQTVS